MKKCNLTWLFIILTLLMNHAAAQPFSLDKKIKPKKLELKKDAGWKGAKFVAGRGELGTEGDYFYVKGASMFQPIDVYLSGPDAADARIEIVKHTWKDIELKGSTRDASDGIANLKLRTYGEFGIRVYSPESSGNYLLLVYASPEVREQLPSPFVKKAAAAAMPKGAVNEASAEGSSANSPLLLIAGGIILLLLVFIVLLIRSKRGKAAVWLFPVIMTLHPATSIAQSWQTLRTLEDIKDIAESKNAENILKKLKELKEQATSIKDLLDSYTGIGDCMDLPSPPGMPSIPSFCPDAAEGYSSVVTDRSADCAGCFMDAREKFTEVRYNLEQLRVIFSCTKSFSKKAISMGDNMSGVHAISGMAWQVERVNIEESVKKMEAAYDLKYAELIAKLQASMLELAACEEQFGTPDWYDRFGYIFYEFVKEKYKRSGD